MGNDEIKLWINLRVQGVDESGTEINALRAAFRLSVISLMQTRLSERVPEETMTGAFLGAAASSAALCGDAFGDSTSLACSWVQYAKSGDSFKSESVSGADFALFIRLGRDKYRLAIFQAKRKRTATDTINLSQIKSDQEKSSGEQQFVRLRKYGEAILTKRSIASPALSQFHWIHYLIYHPEELNCCAMSQLDELANQFSRPKPSISPDKDSPAYGTVNLSSKNLEFFANLLDRGATEPLDTLSVNGWLSIESEEGAKEVAELLVDRLDIYYAEESSSPDYRPAPNSTFGNNKPHNLAYVLSILFDDNGNFAKPKFSKDQPSAEPRQDVGEVAEPVVEVQKLHDGEITVQVENRVEKSKNEADVQVGNREDRSIAKPAKNRGMNPRSGRS